MNPIAEALAYARTLDQTVAAGPDYLTDDLLHEVGELTGGLSVHGFEHDLNTWLDRADRDLDGEPMPPLLRNAALADQERMRMAREWLTAARAIMEPAAQHNDLAA